jgi:hypothetical protein
VSRTAAQAWHELLDGDAGLAAASWDALHGELDRANLVFGGRPLCTVLRPRFLSPEEYRRLSGQLSGLMRAFSAAFARAVADPAALAQFRLQDWERTLVAEDTSGISPSPTSRMDTFVVPGTGAMAITEYNGETPAGAFYNDALGNAFADLPVARAFARDWIMRPLPARHGVLRVLLDSWEQWQGTRALPRIAILDWDDVATHAEFVLCRDFFRARGLVCDIGDPRECEYREGKLWLHGTPVDLVYKRVLIHELIEREGMESPVVRAVRDRAVCFVNGFRSKILHKKASLAVLSDERNAGWFDEAATSAIANHVPWTRLVEERHTVSPDGEPIDLLTWCGDQRANLVLKPNDDYGGAGIVLGWTVDDAAWGAALRHALTTPYIVQRKVTIPRDAYPSFVDGAIVYADRQVDTAPFLCHGQYVEGVLSRLSTAELLNVTAGGGSQTPSFLVERR